MKSQELEDRFIEFAVAIIKLSGDFNRSDASNVLRKQILRSGTSVALNYGESRGAESRKDLIHKRQIVLKELRETYISLKIIKKACLTFEKIQVEDILQECNELISITVASLKTLKRSISR